MCVKIAFMQISTPKSRFSGLTTYSGSAVRCPCSALYWWHWACLISIVKTQGQPEATLVKMWYAVESRSRNYTPSVTAAYLFIFSLCPMNNPPEPEAITWTVKLYSENLRSCAGCCIYSWTMRARCWLFINSTVSIYRGRTGDIEPDIASQNTRVSVPIPTLANRSRKCVSRGHSRTYQPQKVWLRTQELSPAQSPGRQFWRQHLHTEVPKLDDTSNCYDIMQTTYKMRKIESTFSEKLVKRRSSLC